MHRLAHSMAVAPFALALWAAPVQAGLPLEVTVQGVVEYNLIAAPPLGNVQDGEAVTVRFRIDSDVFTDSPSFPTRGYHITPGSYRVQFESATLGLQSPFPLGQVPYFVLRNNDPAVDGFFISTDVDDPAGVPLSQTGSFGPLRQDVLVTYGSDALSTLDVLDALGTYDFTGLMVFNWTVDDGPVNPVGMIFQSLTIALADSAFVDEGSALAGVAGDPRQFGLGNLSAGSSCAVILDRGAPNAAAAAFVALGEGSLAFKGGTLKPFPFFAPIVLATNGAGELSVPFTMPAGVPAGSEVWIQWALQDGAAIQGVSLSNAVRGVTP